jgi:hypothetical protein
VTDIETIRTVNLAPTDDGYANIATTFCRQVWDDLPRKRIAADLDILDSLIEIVAYLAAQGRGDLIERIRIDGLGRGRRARGDTRAI